LQTCHCGQEGTINRAGAHNTRAGGHNKERTNNRYKQFDSISKLSLASRKKHSTVATKEGPLIELKRPKQNITKDSLAQSHYTQRQASKKLGPGS
jgi:hypothetical protein